MSRFRRAAAAVTTAAALALGGSAIAGEQMAGKKKMEAETAKLVTKHKAWLDENIRDWPEKTKGVVATTIEKYGPPQEQTASMLMWKDVGPWKKTVISKMEVAHDFPMPHKDVMEQFVDYRVPAEKFDDLAMYDGSVIAERTKGVLSARCDKEEANFLAINLANDVVTGKKSVDQARKHYAEAIAGMMKGGKLDPYLTGLKFPMMKGPTADADKPAPNMQMGTGGAGMEDHDHPEKMPRLEEETK